jgi:uncharacterized membrane protein YjjB (DUF3815 family)
MFRYVESMFPGLMLVIATVTITVMFAVAFTMPGPMWLAMTFVSTLGHRRPSWYEVVGNESETLGVSAAPRIEV